LNIDAFNSGLFLPEDPTIELVKPSNAGLTPEDIINNFNRVWCGDQYNQCLLCAPDKDDQSKTKWYVCTAGTESYPGVQEINLMDTITVGGKTYDCTPDGWEQE